MARHQICSSTSRRVKIRASQGSSLQLNSPASRHGEQPLPGTRTVALVKTCGQKGQIRVWELTLVISYQQHGKACIGRNDKPDESSTGEDCLFLDIYAPSGSTTKSKLPVFFFIQGGGFNSNSTPNLNGTGLVLASGLSIIVITLNYRVGPYGFLADGEHVTANNGLRDQRKALEWVQQHIAKFGGDPGHVVLGGASAGAASISLHLIANGGKDLGLFHAAAAESVSFATVLTANESRYQFNNLALRLGCSGNGTSIGGNSSSYSAPYAESEKRQILSCLRSKPAGEVQRAINQNIPFPVPANSTINPPIFMWNPVIDGDFLTELTYTAFLRGNFIKHVPVIFGDDTNGGTMFAPKTTSTQAESNQFLRDQFPYLTTQHLAALNALYPNPNQSACPAPGCWWRQASNVYGDMRYMCPGLFLNDVFYKHGGENNNGNNNRSYAYRYNVEDQDQMAQGLGVPHTAELHAVFGPNHTAKSSAPPKSYYEGGENEAVVDVVQAYWISFIKFFDPNRYNRYYHGGEVGTGSGSAAVWRPWRGWDDGQRLLFDSGGKTSMERIDKETRTRCGYLIGIGEEVRQF